jgi:signal transduction histidine kinase
VGIGVAVVAIAIPAMLALVGAVATPANLLVGTAFAWFAGYEVRSQQRLMGQLVEAQSALADQAAATERQRIAREVHDLVAHTLSVTMLHLTGARLALEDADVVEAGTALLEAEKAGREALREMRQAIGLLGTPTTGSALPGAEDLPELIAGYQKAGLRLAFEVQGDLRAVSGDAGLALYRITQESLSNAAKHAPAAEARVTVNVGVRDVCLTVRNDVPAPSPVPRGGRGLPGMAERAQLLGGSFSAGLVGKVWEVHAVLPGAQA